MAEDLNRFYREDGRVDKLFYWNHRKISLCKYCNKDFSISRGQVWVCTRCILIPSQINIFDIQKQIIRSLVHCNSVHLYQCSLMNSCIRQEVEFLPSFFQYQQVEQQRRIRLVIQQELVKYLIKEVVSEIQNLYQDSEDNINNLLWLVPYTR